MSEISFTTFLDNKYNFHNNVAAWPPVKPKLYRGCSL